MGRSMIVWMIILVCTEFISTNVHGQTIKVYEEESVSRMMQQYIAANRMKESIRGWRIQIITTNNRRNMEAARARFMSLYPDIPVNWEHESPYYKVKAGAYEDKISLQSFLQELKKEFPTAIPVMDNIKIAELVY